MIARRAAEVGRDWAAAAVDRPGSGWVPAGSLPQLLATGAEAIREGWLLHRGSGRVLTGDASAGLRLLVGDWCYASGLCDVADAGTLDHVAELADLVADVSSVDAGPGEPTIERRWNEALARLGRPTHRHEVFTMADMADDGGSSG